jgi:uncharacterized protein YndB with AHSA1/START domain
MTAAGSLTVTAPGDREIVMTREFNAPRRLIFDALTQSALVSRWLLGPPGWTMPVCEIDLRVGGTFHYVWRGEDGTEFGIHGVYREISPPDRVVHMESFDGQEGGAAEVTWDLREENGRTTLICTSVYPTREARDAALASGMEHGVAASFDRLEGILGLEGVRPCPDGPAGADPGVQRPKSGGRPAGSAGRLPA